MLFSRQRDQMVLHSITKPTFAIKIPRLFTNIRNRLTCGIYTLIFKIRMSNKNRFPFLKRRKDFRNNDHRLGKTTTPTELNQPHIRTEIKHTQIFHGNLKDNFRYPLVNSAFLLNYQPNGLLRSKTQTNVFTTERTLQLLTSSDKIRTASDWFGMSRVSISVNHPNNFVNSSHTSCIRIMSNMDNTGSWVLTGE